MVSEAVILLEAILKGDCASSVDAVGRRCGAIATTTLRGPSVHASPDSKKPSPYRNAAPVLAIVHSNFFYSYRTFK